MHDFYTCVSSWFVESSCVMRRTQGHLQLRIAVQSFPNFFENFDFLDYYCIVSFDTVQGYALSSFNIDKIVLYYEMFAFCKLNRWLKRSDCSNFGLDFEVIRIYNLYVCVLDFYKRCIFSVAIGQSSHTCAVVSMVLQVWESCLYPMQLLHRLDCINLCVIFVRCSCSLYSTSAFIADSMALFKFTLSRVPILLFRIVIR